MTVKSTKSKHKHRRSLFGRLIDFFYGYDFFISYTRQHGELQPSGEFYAAALVDKLEQRGFKCFLDRKEFAVGDPWKGIGARKLRMTSQLIVIGSEKALDATAVVEEVKVFARKEEGRIIPIDFGGTIRSRNVGRQIFQHLAEDILFIEEDPVCLSSGPSDQTLDRLCAGFNLTRQETKRARFFAGAALVFLLLGIAAGAAALLADRNANTAKNNEIKANANAQSAIRNLLQAHTAQSTEKVGQGLFDEAAAYLVEALRLSKTLVDAQEKDTYSRLHSIIGSGKFPVLTERLEHPRKITKVSFSPNSERLITLCDDGKARLWSFEGGRAHLIGEPIDHAHKSNADKNSNPVAFSHDGRIVAIALGEVLDLREARGGKIARESIKFKQPIQLLAFSSDCKSIFISCPDTSAIIDVASGMALKKFAPFAELPTISPGGNFAVIGKRLISLTYPFKERTLPYEVGSVDGPLRLQFFDLDRFAFVLNGLETTILETSTLKYSYIEGQYTRALLGKMCTSNNGKFRLSEQLNSGSMEVSRHLIQCFSYLPQSDSYGREKAEDHEVVCQSRELENTMMSLSPSGRLLACVTGAGSVQLRDTDTNQVVSSMIRHTQPIKDAIFSPDERFLATIANDQFLRIWRIDMLAEHSHLKSVSLPVQSSRWMPNLFFSENRPPKEDEGMNNIIETRRDDGKRLLTFHEPHMSDAVTPSMANKNSWFGLSDEAGQVLLKEEVGSTFCEKLDFSSCGEFFFCAFSDGDNSNTIIGETAEGKILFRTPDKFVTFEANRKWIVLRSDTNVKVVDVKTGMDVFPPIDVGARLVSAAFSPDGEKIACGFEGETIGSAAWAGVWNIKSATRLMSFTDGAGWEPSFLSDSEASLNPGLQGIVGVAFSPDSRYVATFSARQNLEEHSGYTCWQSRRARIWQLANGRPVGEWLEMNQRHFLRMEDEKRLSDPNFLEEGFVHPYLRPLSIEFSPMGDTVLFRSSGMLVQEWHLTKDIKTEDLSELAEVLSGLHYDGTDGHLITIPEAERIQRWRSLADKKEVIRLLQSARVN